MYVHHQTSPQETKQKLRSGLNPATPLAGPASNLAAGVVIGPNAMASSPSPPLEVGPDGLVRENPVIAYTEKIIEEEQLQLKRYIQENYSKIREVERELENLNLELKLTAGPKKAALEHLRKKIELSTERIRAAKSKEEQAKKAWEASVLAVKEEEDIKQRLCDDLNQLVQESTTNQLSRLEELKRRLAALNPGRASSDVSVSVLQNPTQQIQDNASAPQVQAVVNHSADSTARKPEKEGTHVNNHSESGTGEHAVEAREKKKVLNLGRGKGNIILKGRGPPGSGWTGSGFDT